VNPKPGTGNPLFIAVLLWASATAVAADPMPDIERLDPPLRGFYAKRLVVRGVPILAHAVVSDAAIDEAARRLEVLLGRAPAVAANLNALGAELHVIGKDQAVTDLPQYRHMKGKPFEGKQTMDERGRGYGGIHCSCCEENLLYLPGDRWKDHRDICSHEFAHGIFGYGLDRDLRERWEAQYRKAAAAGTWKGAYAASNPHEYFAELSMWYVGSRGDYGPLDPPPSRGPRWLRQHDPEAYDLLDAIYTGRLAPGRIEMEDLKPLPAAEEGTVRSKGGQPATEIVFVNRGDAPVELFWLDFEGKRQGHGPLPPGSVMSESTYAGHAWLVQSADGAVVGRYVCGRPVGRVAVGESKK
jgi:hypothetical protein